MPQEEKQGEASDSKATPAKAEKDVQDDDNCAMSAHAPLEKRWETWSCSRKDYKRTGRILEVPKLLDHIRLQEPLKTIP